MAKQLSATELDFDKIRANLKTFLQNQDKFNDYNFEGSGLSILIDLLAYNTHYNALNAHFTINEAFIDSAQLRGNVVSHAKLLGYVPRSTIGATTLVDITVPEPIGDPLPTSLTLLRGATLSSVIDGVEYPFVVLDSVTVSRSINETFFFDNIPIKQGIFKTIRDRVDTSVDNQRFIIPEKNIDISTIRVRVRENEDTSNFTIYTQFTTFINATSTSNIYFIQENNEGQYEIYFGDGITGTKPYSNNIVEIEYVYSSGVLGNGGSAFAFTGEIGGNGQVDVELSIAGSYSSGGSDRESIESIRFNAPLTFVTQNRAVTADDYRSIVSKEYGDIEAISTWGGENSDPPDYGKVYISIKPKSGRVLTEVAKNDIREILKGKNVVSVSPEFVDPEYTFISAEVFFKYNPNLTDRTKAELEALVRQKITEYNLIELKRFDGVFRYSALSKIIDTADPGILSSNLRVFMFKDIIPSNNTDNSFELNFSSKTYVSTSTSPTLESTAFRINAEDHFFSDKPIAGSTLRQVYIYRVSNGEKIAVVNDAGVINPATGRITLYSFRPDTTDPIRITVVPNSFDIAPKRNQLIEIDLLSVDITGEIDTIATAGSAGAINYNTVARHK
jgi:hypothetical protein